jgi:hypothetical protein
MSNQVSASRFIVEDVLVGRGQLGYGYSATGVAASTTLWSLARANKYAIEATAGGITITLPPVGTGANEAQPGHDLTIKNFDIGSNAFTIANSLAAPVVGSLPIGGAVKLVADPNAANDWYVVFITPDTEFQTMQDTYNRSGVVSAVPKIQLSTLYGVLDIRDEDVGDELAKLFSIANFGGAIEHFGIGNGVPGTATPIITALNGTAAGMSNSVAVGGALTTSGADADVILLADPSSGFSFADVSSQQITAFPTILKTAGDVQVGTTLTSANEYTVWASSDLVNALTPTAIALISLADNTTYRVTVDVVGRDADPTSTVSSAHTLTALVTRLGLVSTVQTQSDLGFDSPGYTSPSVANLSAAASTLSLNFTAPNNITDAGTTGTMPSRVVVTYSALSIV